jgi:VWFA-related protein
VLLAAVSAAAAQDQPPPKIKSGVEVLAVDVQVVDKEGYAFPRLGPDDFEVAIGGERRRVLSVDLVKHVGPQSTRTPSTGRPDDLEAGQAIPSGRLFVLAVDEHSFGARSAQAAMQAVSRFVENLRPDDLVGLYAYPTGPIHVDPTTNHQAVLDKIGLIAGLYDEPRSEFHLSLTEVSDITAGDGGALARVAARECRPTDSSCSKRVAGEAASLGAFYEMQVAQSVAGLRNLFQGLAAIPQRKTVVLVSGGLLANDRVGGRPNTIGQTTAVGRDAAVANVNLFVLHMDTSFMDAFSKGTSVATSLMADSGMAARGLELIAGAAGGIVVRVEAGTADRALERLLRETSVYYLLAVEVTDADRDGRLHAIRVRVKQRGALVRSRTSVVIPKAR